MNAIRGLTGTPVLVPLRHVLGTSAMRVTHAPLLLVDLHTQDGVTGHAYLFAYLPGAMPALRAMLAEVAAAVIGQDCAPLALAGLLARRFRLLGNQGLARMAAAALDVAAWDVLARQAGLPLARLLGAAPRPIEPVAHHDFAGCARVAAAAQAPVQIGENFSYVPDMARAIAAGACDLVMPDLERIGGVSGWMQAAGLAAAHGLPMSSHLFPEVSAHLLCATPTAHWLEWVDWAVPLLADPPRVVAGCLTPSEAPGNGLGWNAEAVAAVRMAG